MLWPEKFSRKRLESTRLDYVQQGFPEGYSQEYLNYPIDEENAFFQGDDFLPLSDTDENLEYYVGCDFAISEKDRAAFTVMVVAGINSTGKLKIVDVRRFRGDSLEIVDELFILQQRYEPELFIIEKENIARSIGPFLNQEMHKRGIYLTIDDPVPSQDKIKRAQSIRARMRAGQVEFNHDAHWYHTLYTEMTQFPRSQYKDQVDAIANIGLALDKMVVAPTHQELEDEYWEEEESIYLMDQGIDHVTGY
jgi:predicted phage terminase large subunit-like protein